MPERANYGGHIIFLPIGVSRGFSGMLSSVDCMHLQWKNHPKSLHAQYQGHSKEATIIPEAVASKDPCDFNLILLGFNDDV